MKLKPPIELVVVFPMTVPFSSISTTTMPARALSPLPLLSVSSLTKPEIDRNGSSIYSTVPSPVLVSTAMELGVTST